MKKFLVILLALSLCLSMTACGMRETVAGEDAEKQENEPLTTIDVLSVASAGTIPELTASLNDKMGEVRAAYLGKEPLSFESGDRFDTLAASDALYYINRDTFAVEAEVKLGEAFGIPTTATAEQVTAFLGTPTHSGNVSLDLPFADTSAWTVQGYTCGDYTLDLMFNGSAFAGALLCRTETFTR